MRKHFAKLGLLACIAAAGFAGIVWWTAPTHRINEHRFKQIEDGMSLENVEAILRVPPGIHAAGCSTGMYWISWDPPRGSELLERWGGREWVGEEHSIYILFGDDGGVKFKALGETLLEDGSHAAARDRGLLARVLRWFRSR